VDDPDELSGAEEEGQIVQTNGAQNGTDAVNDDEDENGFRLDDLDLDFESGDVDLNHARIKSIDSVDWSRFSEIESLCLRNNLISSLRGLEPLAPSLRELDLHDNQLTKIENLEILRELRVLELSYNRFRKIENLESLTTLNKLFIVHNKLTTIENLGALTNLTYLELGDNRIRKIQNLEALVNLEQLFLGKNKIAKLENLSHLKKLRVLSIQSNRLTVIEGLEELTALETVY